MPGNKPCPPGCDCRQHPGRTMGDKPLTQKEISARFYKRHRKKLIEKSRRERKEHPEIVIETTKRHRKKMRDAGLCVCGRQPRLGKKLCEDCTTRNQERFLYLRQSGLCVSCKAPTEANKTYCADCGSMMSTRHKERNAARKTEGLCVECGAPARPNKTCCIECSEKQNSRAHQEREQLRLQAMTHYSEGKPICAWVQCTIDDLDLLTIDHMNNDGAKHRRMIGHGNICRWLRQNNYPPGFQVLCYNHQILKERQLQKARRVRD